ncbi:MAG: TetR/AcrR family transcriptional regulator [Lachnospiraceae bacterium]|nr:TetR/AcrR family transcriptional regulator [Lachnospiraceae bacterium]
MKSNQILDALQKLLESKDIQKISVSEIAHTAGIGKGSIYYYFPSKEAIMEALIERNYEKPLKTAKNLAKQTSISPFTRMAMIFQACKNSSSEFIRDNTKATGINDKDSLLLHQKYLNHLIKEMKPELTLIIEQGIEQGEISFSHPAALAEIVLIILAIKIDNSLIPSTREEIDDTIHGLISLLEKGTGNPVGSLNFLIS